MFKISRFCIISRPTYGFLLKPKYSFSTGNNNLREIEKKIFNNIDRVSTDEWIDILEEHPKYYKMVPNKIKTTEFYKKLQSNKNQKYDSIGFINDHQLNINNNNNF